MKKKYDISFFQNYAEGKGAKCLSEKYLGYNKALEFICAEDHWFKVSPEKIETRAYWCPDCTGRRQVYNLRSIKAKVERTTKFRFMSDDYKTIRDDYDFLCENGHFVKLNAAYVLENRSCPNCKGRDRLNIEYFQDYAKNKGGRCLSKVYKLKRAPLLFQCQKGHEFLLAPSKLFERGYWCPTCTGRKRRHSASSINEHCKTRNWKFLSKEFRTVDDKYLFECDKGHKVKMIAQNVLKNVGCRTCAGKALLSIDDFHAIAKVKGGKCLSTRFKTSKDKLEFECKEGHRWKASASSVKNSGAWCRKCAGLELGTIEEMQQLAESKGGKCLSKKYVNNATKLKWQCANGHTPWHATPRDIKHSDSWCPYCTGYRNELRVKYLLEILFNKEFQKTREVLGKRFELDGFNEELRIAFEYNGAQHYEEVHFFSKSQTLEKRQAIDKEKKRLCETLNITLIVVPHYNSETDSELYDLIIKELNSNGVKLGIQESKEGILTKLRKLYTNHSEIAKVQELCELKGGKLLSTTYLNKSSALKVVCEKGHEWVTSHTLLDKGKWCTQCRGKRLKRTLAEIQEFAKARGGVCLSVSYSNVSDVMTWKCKNGHIWEAPTSRIIYNGAWCRACSGSKKKTIEEMRAIAKSKGGNCLSENYENTKTKLEWQCGEGHKWNATPGSIINANSWCPICAGKKPTL